MTTVYKKSCDMDALLTKLFYFSKLETGNMPFYKQKIEIASLISDYAKDKKQELADKNVQLNLLINANNLKQIYCNLDTDQIKRVFDNLIENSVKYSQSENLTIDIQTIKNENNIIIQFKDNGKGIAEEKLEHVFELFYRGDEARGSKNDGSGLGLYVCKYIIEQHQGTIKASNNKGFCVDISIPMMNEGD